MLGLHCCAGTFSSCSTWRLLSSYGAQASHCGALFCYGARTLDTWASLPVVTEKAMATHSSVITWRIPGTGGPWWAAIYGVAQSWTRMKQLSSSSSSNTLPRLFLPWRHLQLPALVPRNFPGTGYSDSSPHRLSPSLSLSDSSAWAQGTAVDWLTLRGSGLTCFHLDDFQRGAEMWSLRRLAVVAG